MRNGVSWTRRAAAVLSLSVAAVVIAGPGAGAASVDTYNAQASGTTLSLSVSLPLGDVVAGILGNAGVKGSTISERISFSNATADVTATQSKGSALGQVFFGTLDPTILQVSRLVGYSKDKLPEVSSSVTSASQDGAVDAKKDAIAAVDIGPIHIGVGEVESSASRAGKLVSTKSVARLAGIKVDLASVLSEGAVADLLKPVTDLLDGTGSQPGLIDQLNGLLGGVEQTLKGAGLDVDLTIPEVKTLLSKPLVNVGIIESISQTGIDGASRLARGVTRLANVDLLGGFIHLDAINIESFASIDGTVAGARASGIQRIVGLKIGDNIVNLNTGSLQVLGKTIQMPVELTKLLNVTVDALGLQVQVAQKPEIVRTATHARAATSSLHLGLAPKLLTGAPLFSVQLDGPASVADVRGGSVLGVREVRIPTTGVSDTAMLVVGALMVGLAIGARKFALNK
ncbi:MAG TPA: choice-of-anchor P family protein [Actinomycetota bacterium]